MSQSSASPPSAAHSSAAFGVHVRDLDTGQSFSFHGEERWYLASSIKVPVAIAVPSLKAS